MFDLRGSFNDLEAETDENILINTADVADMPDKLHSSLHVEKVREA